MKLIWIKEFCRCAVRFSFVLARAVVFGNKGLPCDRFSSVRKSHRADELIIPKVSPELGFSAFTFDVPKAVKCELSFPTAIS
jgi:hypothetical protein